MRLRFAMVRRIAVVALAFSLLTGLLPVQAAHAATADQLRVALIKKINNTRAYYGLRRLRVSTYVCPAALLNSNCMTYFAQDHSKRLAYRGKLFHDTSDRLWAEVPVGAWWRAENVGYVTQGKGAAHRVHKAFMASKGHRANILKPRATHVGVGVFQTRSHVWFVERFADSWPR